MTVGKMNFVYGLIVCIALMACGKSHKDPTPVTPPPSSFSFSALKVNGAYNGYTYFGLNTKPVIKISFSAPLDHTSAGNNITLISKTGTVATYTTAYENNDSTVVITPLALEPITRYTLSVATSLESKAGGALQTRVDVQLTTAIDQSDKFPQISDDALLDLVQKQTFKYFWDFGHPTSGLARERNTSGDVVTTGGSGFGIMAIVAASSRNFVSRADALARMQKIVGFLKNTAQKFHGAFPHWMNGATGMNNGTAMSSNAQAVTDTDTSNYPVCSRTVHDKCVQRGAAHRTRRHR